jgi:FdrA protein
VSAAVGALSTREALSRLEADGSIDHVVLVSKPPDAEVATSLTELTSSMSTPASLALLGPGRPDLTAAAESVLHALDLAVPTWPRWSPPSRAAYRDHGTLLRGLFVGGTLCSESALITAQRLGGDTGHTFVDFGDDELTQGRAHPMIDPTLRLEAIARAAADPGTAVLLLDVVLGHGAEPDPAALLAPAIEAVRSDVPVVVACVGTEADPQGLSRQAEALAAAGAEVHLSNARATHRALDLLEATS